MHAEAYTYVENRVRGLRFLNVVEFGSRNVNGTVKGLIDCDWYFGIDLAPGPDVDEVADAVEWSAFEPVDLIVCCEVLEHAPDLEGMVASFTRNLKLGGFVIVTCASDSRAPHSAVDGGPVRPGEHYRNVPPSELVEMLRRFGFAILDVELHDARGDLYVTARRWR